MKNANISLINSLLTILLINSFSSAFGQEIQYSVEKITSNEGLSQNNVCSSLIDSRGFIWFGTMDGLNKYDGYDFKIFKRDPFNQVSLLNNYISALYEGTDSTLWIGTFFEGLNRYNQTTGQMYRYVHDPRDSSSIGHDRITAILQDHGGRIWIGTHWGGLNQLLPGDKSFKRYMYSVRDSNELSHPLISALAEDAYGKLWIGTWGGGLNRFDPETKRFKHIRKNHINFGTDSIHCLVMDSQRTVLWIGTNKGLHSLNVLTLQMKYYPMASQVKTLLRDRANTLWIGTSRGLFFMEVGTNIITQFRSAGLPAVLDVNTIVKDNSEILWVGSGTGIFKIVRNKAKFTSYPYPGRKELDGNRMSIYSIYEDRHRNLWVATEKYGLNKLDRDNRAWSQYKANPTDSFAISSNKIYSILEDHEGRMWIGTAQGGLCRFDRSSGRFVSYKHDPDDLYSISHNTVLAISEDRFGHLWIGTDGKGLNRFDPESSTFEKYPSWPELAFGSVITIVESRFSIDGNSYLWIGKHDGLYHVVIDNNGSVKNVQTFRHIPSDSNSLSYNYITSIYEDPEDAGKTLWVGTNGGGLNKIRFSADMKKARFEHHTECNGFPNNAVFGIMDDLAGNLWMNSNGGIVRFNKENHSTRGYDSEDGVMTKESNLNSYYKNARGEMFFGSESCIYVLDPTTIKDNPFRPKVAITRFKKFDQEILVALDSGAVVELGHNENFFSIEFASLEFVSPAKNKYAYKLEGFDPFLIHSGKRHLASYTNVPPGRYVFYVYASNGDGLWNMDGTQLQIIVHPAFWQTWLFKFCAAALAVVIIFMLASHRVKQLLAIERLRTKIAADLHDTIGSGLTEISILSELVGRDFNHTSGSARNRLSLMAAKSRQLINNMDEIVWLINPKKDTLYDLIIKLDTSSKDLLSFRGMSLTLQNAHALQRVHLKLEKRQHLFLLFKEAINNSIKYSDGKHLVLSAEITGRQLKLVMTDDGCGFDVLKESRGNGLANMRYRAASLGGKLRISSCPLTGTRIEFFGNV